jgi:hypothetical protein
MRVKGWNRVHMICSRSLNCWLMFYVFIGRSTHAPKFSRHHPPLTKIYSLLVQAHRILLITNDRSSIGDLLATLWKVHTLDARWWTPNRVGEAKSPSVMGLSCWPRSALVWCSTKDNLSSLSERKKG